MKKINKIVVTGGSGRFGQCLKKIKTNHKIFFPSKSELNITKYNTIIKYLKKIKPTHLIHLAGLTRPMSLHEKFIIKSLDLNIIGTTNVVKACASLNIKIIYFSTNFDALWLFLPGDFLWKFIFEEYSERNFFGSPFLFLKFLSPFDLNLCLLWLFL